MARSAPGALPGHTTLMPRRWWSSLSGGINNTLTVAKLEYADSTNAMTESPSRKDRGNDTDALPFAAPCKKLEVKTPIRWIKLGWQDLRRAPVQSLSYGAILVACSYLLAFLALTFGNYVVLLALISGFVLLGPILAMAFYDISLQLQRGRTPTVAGSLRRSLHHVGNQMVFAVILLIIFLVWARAASMVHVFFPALADPSLNELATFLAIGSAVGSLFAAFVFCISAFSLPMITDRDADTVTAVVTSFNAVLRNKSAMVVWVLLIIAAVTAGFVTAFIGLGITLPLIGHATWARVSGDDRQFRVAEASGMMPV